MVATVYIVVLILAVIAITYPEDFPKLIRNPSLLLQMVGMETRRRWMILKIGTELRIERQMMRVSYWRMRHIIKAERLKQQQQSNDTPND
jgi:hypothetical protein